MESAFEIFPSNIYKALEPFYESMIEEIRIKAGCPVFIYIKNNL